MAVRRRWRWRWTRLVYLLGIGFLGWGLAQRLHWTLDALHVQAITRRLTPPVWHWHTTAGSAEVAFADGPPIFQHAATLPRPIASTTKMMTAYLVLHDPAMKLSRRVTITPSEVLNDRQGLLKDDSEVPLKAGQVVTVQDLLWALMLPSADDAAWVLARVQGNGNPRLFIDAMNRAAARLGMHHTHYVDPDGVNRLGYSTAKDLMKLIRVDMTNREFRRLVSTKRVSTPGFGPLTNLNLLLWQYPGAIGIKTGWTPYAGSCLAFAARRRLGSQTVTLYGVVLGEPSFGPMFLDVENLLNTGFQTPWTTIVPSGTIVARRAAKGPGAPRWLTFRTSAALGAVDTGGTVEIQYRWKALTTWQRNQVVGWARVHEEGWQPGAWIPIRANQTYHPPWWARI